MTPFELQNMLADRLSQPSNDKPHLIFTSDMTPEETRAQFDLLVKLARSTPAGCEVDLFSSRICEMGTKSCVIYHKASANETI